MPFRSGLARRSVWAFDPGFCVMKATMTLTVLYLVFSSAAFAREDPMKGPWQATKVENVSEAGSDKQSNPGRALVRFYRTYISSIDGSSCGMHPSCSEYSVKAFEKHGFFTGWVMTIDRLFRCGRDELKRSPWIRVDGEFKCYDPLENNDFWWSNSKGR